MTANPLEQARTTLTNQYHRLHARADKWVGGVVARESERYANEFGKDADGNPNPELAEKIKKEVHRCAGLAEEVYLFEPARWAAVSFLLVAGLSIAEHTLRKEKDEPRSLLRIAAGALLLTGLGTAIDLVRIVPRFHARIKGGVDSVLALEKYDENKRAEQEVHVNNPTP